MFSIYKKIHFYTVNSDLFLNAISLLKAAFKKVNVGSLFSKDLGVGTLF